MKKLIPFIFLVFLAFNSGFAGSKEGEKEGSASIHKTNLSGKVIDSETKEELVCAYVIVEGTDIKTATDTRGRFSIKGLEPGKYDLKISYISYKDEIIKNLSIASGKDQNVFVRLNQED